MAQFTFALTNPDVESLLKEEIKLRYPELNLSYSRPGFLTFKREKEGSFSPLFARVSGVCKGKVKRSELDFQKAWVWKRDEGLVIPDELQALSDQSLFKVGELVTLIMVVGPEEFWVGEYELRASHFQTPGEVSSILEKDVPSRAYYKIAEAAEALDLEFAPNERVLELGSAPGGASLFLLDQGLKVLGVDPADMDERVMKNSNFKHLRRPFETLSEEEFKEDIQWLVSDINLPPTVVLKEVYRMLSFLSPKGLVLTLKMNDSKHLEVLSTVRGQFRKRGFTKVELKYLPSHRKEIALIAQRS
jgi:23S rRNA (cytidine2498-2'-O)-methyltransferase